MSLRLGAHRFLIGQRRLRISGFVPFGGLVPFSLCGQTIALAFGRRWLHAPACRTSAHLGFVLIAALELIALLIISFLRRCVRELQRFPPGYIFYGTVITLILRRIIVCKHTPFLLCNFMSTEIKLGCNLNPVLL